MVVENVVAAGMSVLALALTAFLFLGERDLATLFLISGGFDVAILVLFYVFTLRR